jgi:hypothetical protein
MRLAPRKLDRSRIRRYTRKPPTKAPSVTVCIAALCHDPPYDIHVVCAADRMMTAGVGGDADIEYEPLGTPKLLAVTNSIAMMPAGDGFVQSEIVQRMSPEIVDRIVADPKRWFGVREVAEMYCKHYDEVFQERANAQVFVRYGIDFNTFKNRNKDLAPATIGNIVEEMRTFQAEYPGVWTIFAGLEPRGAHIYSVLENTIYCHDGSGFAAAGVGARHASSQFMLARHSIKKTLAETVRLAYFAKKRSEVAPGVGTLTDMCLIGPTPGSLEMFDQASHIAKLQELYQESLHEDRQLQLKSQDGINKFVIELKNPPTGQASGPIITGTGTLEIGGLSVTGTGTVTPPDTVGHTRRLRQWPLA